MQSIGTPWLWISFVIFISVMVLLDLAVSWRETYQIPSFKKSLVNFAIWVSLALLFNLFLWIYLRESVGSEVAFAKATEFLTGYSIEKLLSFDNMFVFLMIFRYFEVPLQQQHRILFLGILGAMICRLVLILLGVWIVSQFQWVLYLFGAFLIFTGLKFLFPAQKEKALTQRPFFKKIEQRLIQWHVPRFFLVLCFIELSDILFALDSIPVIFAITQDPFIIFSSNMFAILGLRSLYFLLADLSERFEFLNYAVGLLLILIGMKMLVSYWFHLPAWFTLASAFILLVGSMVGDRYAKRFFSGKKRDN